VRHTLRMSSKFRLAVGLSLAVLGPGALSSVTRAGQALPPGYRQAAAISVDDATALTNGWAALAQGEIGKAAERAAALSVAHPRHPAVFALALEVEIARGGAMAGAEVYERWIGSRTTDEPVFVRRVAVAALEEAAAQTQDAEARLKALTALAGAGDVKANAALASAVNRGEIAETRTMAARGDERAVQQLAKALSPSEVLPNPVSAIQALGESGSRLAVPALEGRLTDARPEVRGAAAEALARTAGTSALPRLRALINDQSSHVRVKAAAALYRLNDPTGSPLLREMAASESPQVRLVAAEALSPKPDATWQALVRGLTQAPEPDVRLAAARMAATFDRDLASSVLGTLGQDANQAISQEASRTLAGDVARDLGSLRGLLRHRDRLTRVGAAATVLTLTR
jgi:HEAT repeat protein